MKICFSCVVDQNPVIRMQSLNLLASIRAYALENCDIFFNLIGSHPTHYIESCLEQGVHLVQIESFGGWEARYCNKLRQLKVKELRDYDIAVLCDTDIAFVENIHKILDPSLIQAKYVDTCTPPLEILNSLLAKAGISSSGASATATHTKESTLEFYCNGGLYVIPTHFLDSLAEKWEKYARFCLQELPQPWTHYSDQTAFAMAMAELRLPFRPLPGEWNYPVHFAPESYLENESCPVSVLHYHDRLDDNAYIKPVGVPFIDVAVEKANHALRNHRRTNFNNTAYWDYRYAAHSSVGSGIGSRGAFMDFKRKVLYPLLSLFRHKDILDVGCGDLEVMCESDALHYTGLDRSAAALNIAKEKRPDWKFICGDITSVEKRADISLCIDVLIHIPHKKEYRDLVRSILDYTKEVAVFAAFNRPPQISSHVCFFHEPIVETLKKDPRVGEITVLGEYRDITLLLAHKKTHTVKHPADIPLYTLAANFVRSPYQDLTLDLIDLSRKAFGFFTRTPTRVLEYPWIAHTIGNASGKRVLDIGAGINPLPLWFSKNNAHVTTADLHEKVFTKKDLPNCNEWGFFDYSCIDDRITSLNKDAKDLSDEPFDVLYSCSAIEHIPRKNRIENVHNWFSISKPGGQLVVTIDLVPGTRRLWNYCEGKPVEPRGEHGDLDGFLLELNEAGFTVKDIVLETDCPLSNTDIAMINAFRT
ncbi:class I SAM-dependent methyltransferase [Desulfovibrio sp.]|uniref:class I SAM-dependent methyltransferase n=1 Tax=Desulfovibrio sp. TaxID=885 RepID=UPI003D122156